MPRLDEYGKMDAPNSDNAYLRDILCCINESIMDLGEIINAFREAYLDEERLSK